MRAVEFLPSAVRELAKLEPSVRRRLARTIDRLAEAQHPAGAVKLRGSDDVWRVRVGYRVLYAVEHDRRPSNLASSAANTTPTRLESPRGTNGGGRSNAPMTAFSEGQALEPRLPPRYAPPTG